MTRQEEIKEHLTELFEQTDGVKEPVNLAEAVLWVLNEDDVVVRVDRELPILHWCQLCESYVEGTDLIGVDWASCSNENCKPGNKQWKFKASYEPVKPLITQNK